MNCGVKWEGGNELSGRLGRRDGVGGGIYGAVEG